MQDDTQIVYQSLHNPSNRYLTIHDLKLIFQKAGILEELEKNGEDFTKWDLPNFQRAFTHISYTHNRSKKQGKNVIENEDEGVNPEKCLPIQEQSMERLE